jgi:deoxyribodipyrimidine photo-lyase
MMGVMSSLLPTPEPDRAAVLAFVGQHLAGLYSGPLAGSHAFVGGQSHADAALARFDVTGYADTRNEVWPAPRRGASGLSPFIRHGFLQLHQVWNSLSGPPTDVSRFRDELMWQEYARHWYARVGARSATSMRHDLVGTTSGGGRWDRSMACLDMCVEELEDDGWLVNQARMWLASHWSVRHGGRWTEGEDIFFTHLLDGSRAANRLGWQWTTGAGSSKAYGFSRWQVEKRAPGLCGQCDRSADCPIEEWPAGSRLA